MAITPVHTYRHLDEELDSLRQRILLMGGLVEKQVAQALTALVQRNAELAAQTIARDHTVNRMECEIDALCIELLARYQPTARDLRLVTTGLKISTDLERIGDLAAHICQRAEELIVEPPLLPLIDLPHMATIAQRMLRESLDAFVREDAALAFSVCAADHEIDALNDQFLRILLTYMAENPQTVTRVIRLSFVAKYLERIADHATNVAERVVFMVRGQTIRHAAALPDPPPSLN
jgi:phosphate transport system protein